MYFSVWVCESFSGGDRMNILSIDWDFFMDVSDMERTMYFPDGGNEGIGLGVSTMVWLTRYLYNSLEDIGVVKEYETLLEKLSEYGPVKVIITDSHKWMATMCEDIEQINIWNIDFHHDAFGDGPLNCGNWVNVLKREKDVTVKWIGREDSLEDRDGLTERCSWEELPEEVDWIYLCRSSVWSPPHLDGLFCRLAEEVEDICQGIVEIEPLALRSRWEEIKGDVERMRQDVRNMYGSHRQGLKRFTNKSSCLET